MMSPQYYSALAVVCFSPRSRIDNGIRPRTEPAECYMITTIFHLESTIALQKIQVHSDLAPPMPILRNGKPIYEYSIRPYATNLTKVPRN